MRTRLRAVVVLFAALTAVASVVSTASASPSTPLLTNVRVGAHATYDRIVLDFTGPKPTIPFAQVVPELTYDGSGLPVNLPGTYFYQVVTWPGAAHDDNGDPTYTGPRKFTTPQLSNVQAFAITGDFEGQLTVGLGYRRATWQSVSVLENPTRVVIDIGV
ncbi:AMIN-like domain-containing (lipo)protein [Umezawaea sp.]|uniref:AMIN-like domain-containing (lipo)protein n=1 Tax=Umezawaea sp. TaxID=1955258 RepID=UPI002ED44375